MWISQLKCIHNWNPCVNSIERTILQLFIVGAFWSIFHNIYSKPENSICDIFSQYFRLKYHHFSPFIIAQCIWWPWRKASHLFVTVNRTTFMIRAICNFLLFLVPAWLRYLKILWYVIGTRYMISVEPSYYECPFSAWPDCEIPDTMTNATYSRGVFPNSNTLTFTCEGYSISLNTSYTDVTCVNGLWDAHIPHCQGKNYSINS